MTRAWFVFIVAMAGAFAAGWAGAQGTRGAALSGQDYAEIEMLMSRYNQAVDFEDRDMIDSIWTDDAVWAIHPARISPNGARVEGRESIVNMYVQRWAARPQQHERRHWQNNLVVTPTAGGATSRVYVVSFEVSYSPPKPALSGHYDDVLVRTPDGWRIKERILTLDTPLREEVFGYVW